MANAFRQTFRYGAKDVTHFFPGHMARGLKDMQKILKNVDCVVEIHDARIPLTGRNPKIHEAVGLRPHILILNKMDLAHSDHRNDIDNILLDEGIRNVLYTNSREDFHYSIKRKIIPKILHALDGLPRFHREEADDYNVLVVGIPNVGKSSFINAIRRTHLKKGKASPVGAVAGVTRSLMEKIKVCELPKMYLYDTPGIMIPNITNPEMGMKLALCGTLQDHRVGEDLIADYLLYWLNKHQKFKYRHFYGLPEPTDDILYLLAHICKQSNWLLKTKSSQTGKYVIRPDFMRAAKTVVADFRAGKLGRINLDIDIVTDRAGWAAANRAQNQ